MKKIFLTGLLALVFTVLSTSSVWAQTKAKTAIKLPTFMAGEAQVVDENVDGDLMVAGRQVKITANISGDAYVAGREVEITGNINGDLIVVGSKVTISGKVLKNLIMAGGQAVVNDSAVIGGYALIGGGKVDLSGNFSGPVRLGTGTLVVDQKAVINGTLEADVRRSEIASGSKIVGEKNIRIHEAKKTEEKEIGLKKISYGREIFSFLSKLLVLLIFVKLFGQKIKEIKIKSSFWSAMGSGLLILIGMPVLFFLLLITVIAAPLSVIILGVYLLGIYLSTIVTSVILGNYMAAKYNLKTNSYINGTGGLLLITLIRLIPMVDGLTSLIVFLFGTGIIFKGLKAYFFTPAT